MDLNKYRHDDWIVYFSGGKWAPLGFSAWAGIYTRVPFSKEINNFISQAVIVWDGEATTCYIRESEREKFGKKLVQKAVKDSKFINFISHQFSSSADTVLSMQKKLLNNFSLEDLEKYNNFFTTEHYPYHVKVKNIVDFLPENLRNKYLPVLEAARVHAEPVFSEEVKFIKKMAEFLAKEVKYNPVYLQYILYSEILGYWKKGKKFPSEDILKARSEGCVIFFEKGKVEKILTGQEIFKFSHIFSKSHSNKLNGQIAFKGIAKGTVRIILDPLKVKIFNEGDILVAPWTRPEYLPIMKKAGAFITDGGGILSHAAIVARELKKPCIIGTKSATQILKDGDLIEVNANNGIVKILSSKS
ncbi:MAG: PEP-utilizing enzyme [Patescibacteria group bacterium]